MTFQKRQNEDRNHISGHQRLGREKELSTKELEGNLWDDGNVLYLDHGGNCMTV